MENLHVNDAVPGGSTSNKAGVREAIVQREWNNGREKRKMTTKNVTWTKSR